MTALLTTLISDSHANYGTLQEQKFSKYQIKIVVFSNFLNKTAKRLTKNHLRSSMQKTGSPGYLFFCVKVEAVQNKKIINPPFTVYNEKLL